MTFAEAVAQAATPEYMEHNGGQLCVRRDTWGKHTYVFCRDGQWVSDGNGVIDLQTDGVNWSPYKIPKPKPLSETLECGDVVRQKDNHAETRVVTGRNSDGKVLLAGLLHTPADIDAHWELTQ